MKPIRWGILSTANIAHAFVEGVLPLEDAEVVAVGSRAQATADEFADQYDIPRRYASYQALADDPDIDVIYIATPHVYHYENSLMCLYAGKAVLCEKPFAINVTEAQTVLDLAKEKNLFIMDAIWTRFQPAFRKIQSLIMDDVIGEVRLIIADFGINRDPDPVHRLFNPSLGGGALLDLGLYPVMLACTILGRPSAITSTAHMGETGVDVQAGIAFHYEKGQIANLTISLQADTPLTASIVGTKGRIDIPHGWWFAEHFSVVTPDGKEDYEFPFEHNGYTYEAEETMRCLREGAVESPIMSHDDTLLIMHTLDSIRKQWGLVYPTE